MIGDRLEFIGSIKILGTMAEPFSASDLWYDG